MAIAHGLYFLFYFVLVIRIAYKFTYNALGFSPDGPVREPLSCIPAFFAHILPNDFQRGPIQRMIPTNLGRHELLEISLFTIQLSALILSIIDSKYGPEFYDQPSRSDAASPSPSSLGSSTTQITNPSDRTVAPSRIPIKLEHTQGLQEMQPTLGSSTKRETQPVSDSGVAAYFELCVNRSKRLTSLGKNRLTDSQGIQLVKNDVQLFGKPFMSM